MKWVCFVRQSDYLKNDYIKWYEKIFGKPEQNLYSLDDGDKFIAIIKYAHSYHSLLESDNDFTYFLKHISPAVNEGRCLLLLDTCCHPFSTAKQPVETYKIYTFLTRQNIYRKDNILVLTSLHGTEKDKNVIFKSIFWEYFESALKLCDIETTNVATKINNFLNNNKTYRFLYLNHKEHAHRLYLFIKVFLCVKEARTKIAASMCPCSSLFNNTKSPHIFEQFIKEAPFFSHGNIPKWFFNSSKNNFITEFRKLTNIQNEVSATSVSTQLVPFAVGNKWRDIRVQWLHGIGVWESIGIYVGVETNYFYSRKHMLQGDDYLTLTEKTFKPIAMKAPFILYGQPFILRKLREYGYKTFSEFWDEGYDEEIDPALRADKIADVIKTLVDIPDKKFTDLLIQTNDIVEHNYYIFKQRKPEKIMYDYITNFLY